MGLKGAALLMSIFEREKGRMGRLSMQTNPAFYRNPAALVEQAMHFHSLAPNIQIKIPATAAGIPAIEEVTYRGGTINATVCFTVPRPSQSPRRLSAALSACGRRQGLQHLSGLYHHGRFLSDDTFVPAQAPLIHPTNARK